MKTLTSVKKLALGLAIGGLFAWQAGATLAYSIPVGQQGSQPDGPYALGDLFTISSGISVDALGAFTPNGSFSSPVEVAIYSITMNGQSIGSSSLVTPVLTFDGSYSPGVALQSLGSPVNLAAGTYMVVANNQGGGGGVVDYNPAWNSVNAPNPAHTGINSMTAASGINFSQNGYFTSTGPLTGLFPTTFGLDNYWTAGGPHYGAGNFDFTPVPEAAGFALAGIAMLGLVYVGRAYSQKLKVA
jgi:hypothetical protein